MLLYTTQPSVDLALLQKYYCGWRMERLKVALLQPAEIKDWERGEIDRISALVKAAPDCHQFTLVASPDAADLVVLLESCSFKTRKDIGAYESLPFLRNPFRLCCINYEDGPPGFLPGLYSSLESHRFDPAIHVSWPHLRLPNEHSERRPVDASRTSYDMLFVFSGACSHPLRRRLFEEVGSGRRSSVRRIDKWYNHSESEKLEYVDEILRSKFVLCPRGLASYSHRIVESLALGRVPVVIADDWVPFSIEESGYFVRIRERDIGRIEALLTKVEPGYEQMQHTARVVYRRYFAPEVRYSVALNRLCKIYASQLRDIECASLTKRWNSRSFHYRNGWCLEQRVLRRAVKFGSRIRERLSAVASGGPTLPVK
jgi:hypothetical protein